MIQAALPHLEKTKGNVVTINSVSGRDNDFTAGGPYGAMKAALLQYTSGLAHNLATKGVRANSVSPGNIYVEDGTWGNVEREMPEFFKAQMALNPMGRMGKPVSECPMRTAAVCYFAAMLGSLMSLPICATLTYKR